MPGDISYRSTACELLKENQQGGNKLPPPHSLTHSD